MIRPAGQGKRRLAVVQDDGIIAAQQLAGVFERDDQLAPDLKLVGEQLDLGGDRVMIFFCLLGGVCRDDAIL